MRKLLLNDKCDRLRLAIVTASWHATIGQGLLKGALKTLTHSGCSEELITLIEVPGTFELPQACQFAAESGKYDVIVALGVVIRGETPHFDYICSAAAHGLTQVGLKTNIPVTFGVITADTVAQAVARSSDNDSNKGHEAALAAVQMAKIKLSIERQE